MPATRFQYRKWILLFIIIIGFLLRFYRIRQTMQFLGDQGRDALIARKILLNHHIELIGPVTSVGNMYLGPGYYYFMVLPLMLTYPDPIGPVIAVAFLGGITVWLVYRIGRHLVGEDASLIASLLYAVSPVVIAGVRFSWNPNIVPFFSILLIGVLWSALKGKQSSWVMVGIICAVLLQLHYITLILIGLCILVWFYMLLFRREKLGRMFVVSTLLGLGLFLLSLIPLVLFDFRHNFINTHALLAMFSAKPGQGHFRSLKETTAIFYAYVGLTLRSFFELIGIQILSPVFRLLVFMFLVVGTGVTLGIKRGAQQKYFQGSALLFFLFAGSIAGLSLYNSSIFDHYLGFLFPIVFLCVGILLDALMKSFAYGKMTVAALCTIFVFFSLLKYPGLQKLTDTVDRTKDVSRALAKKVGNNSYDILLYSSDGDLQGMNYRYFLTAFGKPPVENVPIGSYQRLYIIDEIHTQPILDTRQYAILLWPNRTIVDDFTVDAGPRIVELSR